MSRSWENVRNAFNVHTRKNEPDSAPVLYNWEDLGNTFGESFVGFCQKNRIFPKKMKSGAFMVPDNETLTLCKNNLTRQYKKPMKIDLGAKKMRRAPKDEPCRSGSVSQLAADFNDSVLLMDEEDDVMFEEIQHENPYLVSAKTEIMLKNNFCKRLKRYKFPASHVLEKSTSGAEIFKHILTTDIGISDVNCEQCVADVAPILVRLQKCHKRFNYYCVLKSIARGKTDEPGNADYRIPMKQLQTFFLRILNNVVPPALFGNNRNKKKIKKTIYKLLRSARAEPIVLKRFIGTLNISSITWLRRCEDMAIKWLLLTKLVKWFFVDFVSVILYSQVYITSTSPNGKERIYIMHEKWKSVTNTFFQKMKNEKILVNKTGDQTEEKSLTGSWLLYPKSTGLRPILHSKVSKKEKENDYMVRTLLDQLCITHYDRFTLEHFYKQWKAIIKKGRTDETLPYMVSCDIQDAYGSINQQRLFDIVASLCVELPNNIKLMRYAVFSPKATEKKKQNREKLCYKSYNLEPFVSANTLFCPTQKKCYIKKDWFLEEVKKHIFRQQIQFAKQTYSLTVGLGQGPSLSACLSNIYYGHMVQHELSNFTENGNLCRYIDDFLYITESRRWGERFLDMIRKGIDGYNCRFQKPKTQTNIYSRNSSANSTVSYLGFNINGNTLAVTPAYSDVHIHYMPSLRRVGKAQLMFSLKCRMNSMAALKLEPIVLDDTINSKSVIRSSIKRASVLHAKRCSVLIRSLFDAPYENSWTIFKVIRNSNKRIIKKIIKNTPGEMSVTLFSKALHWSVNLLAPKILSLGCAKSVPNHNIHYLWNAPVVSKITSEMRSDVSNPSSFLRPVNTSFIQTCGMKRLGRLKLRCKDCYFVTRQERLYVMCKSKPRHKQMSFVPILKNTWILTHASQKPRREW